VQTRLDLWLKTHIEKFLGPLFDLAKAEDVTGIARGIAFQLIEALGVLERQKIAAEMKDLDQPSRAVLRKYGVRFGAYHIYVPGLLKPAARALASLLWAQKHDNVDLSALSGAQHLAGSGRTSFPVDKQLDRDAYRALGYRQCGERAVRVDILERLADLIRPALSWREGSLGDKPAGAFDGRGFVITQAMTSLTGSAGEDFASILRALGYRMDKRPPLPPAPPKPIIISEVPTEATNKDDPIEGIIASETPSTEMGAEAAPAGDAAVASEPAVAETSEIAEITSDTPEPVEASAPEPHAAPSATLLPDVAFSTPSEPAVEAEPDPASPVAEAAAVEAPQEPVAPEVVAPEAAAPDSAAPAADVALDASTVTTEAAAVATEAAVPEMVEVWRPGGRSEERRPRHDRNRHRNQDRQPAASQSAPAEGEAAAAGEGAKRERHRGRRQRHGDFQAPRRDAPAAAVATAPAAPEGAPTREARDDKGRPPRERFQDRGKDRGKDRGDKGRDRDKGKFGGPKGGREGRDGGASHRQYATSAPPSRERDRPVDPNSPFAKLAALKEQLAANRKDQR
jgi:ATP-dependent RNA helicase SUPV3L1/SUV3